MHRAGVPAPLYDKMVRGESLSIGDVVTLSKDGVGDAVIVRYIREQGTVYRLKRGDFAQLHAGGVSQSVIDFMGPHRLPRSRFALGAVRTIDRGIDKVELCDYSSHMMELKLSRIGNSRGIRLPASILKRYQMEDGHFGGGRR